MTLLFALATETHACSFDETPDLFELDTGLPDDEPPVPPVLVEVVVDRGHGQDGKGCSTLGSLAVRLARPAGDPDGEDDVGYRVEQVAGQLPNGAEFSGGGAPLPGPTLRARWDDGAGPWNEDLDVTLAIVAVDRAGNEAQALEVVVSEPGCGCGHAGPSGAWALSALLVVLRRRFDTSSMLS